MGKNMNIGSFFLTPAFPKYCEWNFKANKGKNRKREYQRTDAKQTLFQKDSVGLNSLEETDPRVSVDTEGIYMILCAPKEH